MREIDAQLLTKNIKEMCIEANHYLSDDMKKDNLTMPVIMKNHH